MSSSEPAPPHRRWARPAGALALTAALVLAVPLSAAAHVHVSPDTGTAGADDTLLTFTVPNESDSAFTTRVRVDLPTATPFGEVAYDPVPGWTAKVTTATLTKPVQVDGATVTEAPVRIVWTADPGTRLTAGQEQLFTVSVGPMPDTDSILLPTTQTYSDGTVVRWDEPTPASGEEPEHPAPTLAIRAAAPEAESGAPASASAGASAGASAQPSGPTVAGSEGTAAASQGMQVLPIALSGAALLVGLAALVFAVAALLRGRRVSHR